MRSSLTVCLNLLICELAFTYQYVFPVVICLHIRLLCAKKATYLLTYVLTYLLTYLRCAGVKFYGWDAVSGANQQKHAGLLLCCMSFVRLLTFSTSSSLVRA